MSASQSSIGLVLRTRDYKEQDRWVDILTASSGRISCLAKGVRKPNSRRQGALQPATLVKFSWISLGDTNLLTEAMLQKSFLPWPAPLDTLRDISAILEIVYHISLEQVEQAELLAQTQGLLSYLAANPGYHRGAVRQELFDLLSRQGIEALHPSNTQSVSELVESVLGRPLKSWRFLRV